MNESILTSVKKALGILEDVTVFDAEIIMHINSIFANLTQVGVGPEDGFAIDDSSAVWSDFIGQKKTLQNVKSFMFIKVKILFDPPQTSVVMEALQAQAKEIEYRLYVETDNAKNSSNAKASKVGNYLYSIEFDKIDQSKGKEWVEKNYKPSVFCTIVRKSNLIGRNLDWYYNYDANIYVKVKRTEENYAWHGVVSAIPQLSVEVMENEDYKHMVDAIPFLIVDGINEYGLFAGINVVNLDSGHTPTIGTIPEIQQLESVCMSTLPKYILDNFKSAAEAISYIKNFVSVYANKVTSAKGMEAHITLSDKTGTYVMEFINNEIKVIVSDVITNFYLYGVEFNEDGTVYTPETQDETHNAMDTNNIFALGMGLERFNIIKQSWSTLVNKNSLVNIMINTLDYENAYKLEEGIWYTEFVGQNSQGYLTVKSNPLDFEYIVSTAKERYSHRDRSQGNNGIWCTAHTSIYDVESKSLYLYNTSDNKSKEYKFNL